MLCNSILKIDLEMNIFVILFQLGSCNNENYICNMKNNNYLHVFSNKKYLSLKIFSSEIIFVTKFFYMF